ncbi:MAG TPA: molecular chaperone TorD family protein, partial [Candidatus Brocadiaceae bacterium]
LAPPWESVYRSPDGILFQEPTIKVRESYLNTGFTLSKKTPEDHIGLELMFMRILIKKYLDAKHKKERKDILDMQKDFLARHIQSWVSKFCKDVANNAKTDFYKGLAMMTEGFIQFEVSSIIDVSS